MIRNVKVYGMEESFKASKYPMSVDIDELNSEMTKTIRNLGSCAPGTGHDQMLTGIIVQFDLAFTLKAWTEAQRYGFFHFVSSQSTMHRITKFNIRNQCNQYVDKVILDRLEEIVKEYEANPIPENYLKVLYNIPTGFRLTARMTTNYRQLKTMYLQRKGHRLPEWREFCAWCRTLPFFCELCLGE